MDSARKLHTIKKIMATSYGTILNPIVVEITSLTNDMVNWYKQVGGKLYQDEYWDYKGNKKNVYFVGYGKGKYCHYRKDGSNGVRLHFNEEDASIATMFIMQFTESVQLHNITGVHFR